LDNLLLTTGKVSVDGFYALLGGCSNEIIRQFLNFAGLQDTDKFFRFYEKFKSNRYLDTYVDTQQIAYALKRICMRVWDDPFTPEHEKDMSAIITTYREGIYDDFILIFDEITTLLRHN
jgi:hypothetical protein